jgi:hypothetical protein
MTTTSRLIPLALALLLALPQPAASAQDIDDAAATALAIFGGVGFLNQAITHSKLEVIVEVFHDSKVVNREAFTLDRPAVASGLRGNRGSPISHPTTQRILAVERALKEPMKRLRSDLRAMENYRQNSIQAHRSFAASTYLQKVDEYYALQGARTEGIVKAWDRYLDHIEPAKLDGKLAPQELETAAVLLSALQDAIERSADPLSESIVKAIAEEFKAAIQTVRSMPVAKFTAYDDAVKGVDSFTDPDRMWAMLLNGARELLLALTPAELTTVKSDVTDVLQDRFQLGITVEQLLAFNSQEHIFNELRQGRIELRSPVATARAATSTVGRVFNAATSGQNIGPVGNEVLQVLLSGDAMDIISDPHNDHLWHEVNRAKSSSGAGNHTAVIYLENLATPSLKSGEFDPSAFIRANAKLYKTAFLSTAAILGAPTAAADGAEPDFSAYNLINIKRKARKAEREQEAILSTTIESVRQILSVYAAPPGGDAAKELLEGIATAIESVGSTD